MLNIRRGQSVLPMVTDHNSRQLTPGVSWYVPIIVAEGVQVVHVDLRANPARESLAMKLLDDGERQRCVRYLPGPRRHFVLCRAALRSILCSYLDCSNSRLTFPVTEFQKPLAFVGDEVAAISFNVSHSGEHGLIAISLSGRVGVDVEEVAPKRHLQSLIESVMGPDEQRELAQLAESRKLRQFFRLWTCKEALIKALGTGFSTDISGFQVPANMRAGDSSAIFRFPHLPQDAWQLEDISSEAFVAALAREIN